jgi:hypothetical protein
MSEPIRLEPYRGLVIPRSLFDELLPIWPRVLRRAYEEQSQSTSMPWQRSTDGLLYIERDDVVIRTMCPQTLLTLIAGLGISVPDINFAHYPLPAPAPSGTPERFLSRTPYNVPVYEYMTGEFVVGNVDEQVELVLEIARRWSAYLCVVAETSAEQQKIAAAIRQHFWWTTPITIIRGVAPQVTSLPIVASILAFLDQDLLGIPVVVVLAGPNGLTRQIRRCLARLNHARLYLVRLAESLGRDDDDEYVQLTVGYRLSEPSHPDSSRTYRVIRCSARSCPDLELANSAKPIRIWRNDARNAAIVRLARRLQRTRVMPDEDGTPRQVVVLVESDVHADMLHRLLAPTEGETSILIVRLNDLKLSSPDLRAETHLINAIGGPPSAYFERFLNRAVLRHRFVSLVDVSTPADARFTRARIASYRRAGLASEPRARTADPAVDSLA